MASVFSIKKVNINIHMCDILHSGHGANFYIVYYPNCGSRAVLCNALVK